MDLRIDTDELKPLIEAVAAELLRRFPPLEDRLAYSQDEAAALLGIAGTSLGDERRRGRVDASLVGRRIRYTREDLLTYLASRKWSERHDAEKEEG